MIRFTLTAESRRTLARVTSAAQEVETRLDPIVGRITKSTRDSIVNGILNNEFPLAPLAPFTVARKSRLGLDPRTLVATKHYVESFQVMKLGPSSWALDGDTERAELLETGTTRMPARPHLRAAIQRALENPSTFEGAINALFGD